MVTLAAGDLNRLITIQSRGSSADSYGEKIANWSELDQVWAQLIPMRRSERFTARQLYGEEINVFRIRYRDDVPNDGRIVYNNKAYEIIAKSLK